MGGGHFIAWGPQGPNTAPQLSSIESGHHQWEKFLTKLCLHFNAEVLEEVRQDHLILLFHNFMDSKAKATENEEERTGSVHCDVSEEGGDLMI